MRPSPTEGRDFSPTPRASPRTGMPASGRREDASGRGRDADASGGVRAAARIAARRSDGDARGGRARPRDSVGGRRRTRLPAGERSEIPRVWVDPRGSDRRGNRTSRLGDVSRVRRRRDPRPWRGVRPTLPTSPGRRRSADRGATPSPRDPTAEKSPSRRPSRGRWGAREARTSRRRNPSRGAASSRCEGGSTNRASPDGVGSIRGSRKWSRAARRSRPVPARRGVPPTVSRGTTTRPPREDDTRR